MSYLVLARKWRPRDFASLVGQDHVVRALTHALEKQRLHHAYLFTGTRGVGKTTLSRILAKAFNCVGPDGRGGVTATPCNRCDPCTAIDAGRFVDYIELDAASNRGVDEMTALLERAAYAPSAARFKVYMIDEVHMLSTHAFNAMLKTLEEPPDYVKFILATTDPQKVPVTVLSRCLQFNLKQMTPGAIAGHLQRIASEENVDAEPAALRLLAHGARGSMRDGLSLLDQAIAYGAGRVELEGVRGMLGTIDAGVLVRLLDALLARDAKGALAIADEMAARSLSFAQALRDLGSLLHWIAVAQQVPDAVGDDVDEAEAVQRLARAMPAEDVQLFYQIVLHGRNDLVLAPDEYAGFTMTLLRMLAFVPLEGENPPARQAALLATRPPRTTAPAPQGGSARSARPDPPMPSNAGAPGRSGERFEPPAAPSATSRSGERASTPPLDWPALVAGLAVNGMTRELAAGSELVAVDGDVFRLRVAVKALAEAGTVERLRGALASALGKAVRLAIEFGETGDTAAARAEQARIDKQQRAEQAIDGDPFVQQLIDNFGATIDRASIRPAD
jgi:DNA polymerase-3 subunit gamma/tau